MLVCRVLRANYTKLILIPDKKPFPILSRIMSRAATQFLNRRLSLIRLVQKLSNSVMHPILEQNLVRQPQLAICVSHTTDLKKHNDCVGFHIKLSFGVPQNLIRFRFLSSLMEASQQIFRFRDIIHKLVLTVSV